MLTPGTPVDLETHVANVPVLFGATIVAVSPDLVTVRVSLGRGVSLPVDVGTEVTGDVVHRSEIVTFDTTVLGRARNNSGVDLILKAPESFREEHRSFYRFNYRLPVTVRLLDTAGKAGSRIYTETIDIGGGGVGVLLKQSVEPGERVSVRLQLEDDAPERLVAEGRIVRVVEQRSALAEQWRVGILFEKISGPDRERLIQFIFSKQRELRQKGFL